MESRDNPRYPFTAEAEVIELQSGHGSRDA